MNLCGGVEVLPTCLVNSIRKGECVVYIRIVLVKKARISGISSESILQAPVPKKHILSERPIIILGNFSLHTA